MTALKMQYQYISNELLKLVSLGLEFVLVDDTCLHKPHKDIDLVCLKKGDASNLLKKNGYHDIYPDFSHLLVKYLERENKWVVLDISNKYGMASSYLMDSEITKIIKRQYECSYKMTTHCKLNEQIAKQKSK